MKKNQYVDAASLNEEAGSGRSPYLYLLLIPLAVPILLIAVASFQAGSFQFPSLLLLFLSYLLFLLFLFFGLLYIRYIHFSVWRSLLLRFRKTYGKRGDEIPEYTFSLFGNKSMEGQLEELKGLREAALDKERKKYGRQSTFWNFNAGFMTFLGASARSETYIKKAFKSGRDHMHREGVGLVQLYYASGLDEPDSVRDLYDWYSGLTEKIFKAVVPFGGMLQAMDDRSISVIVSGGWSARETAIRALRCAQKIREMLEAENDCDGFLIAADYFSVMEGVWSGTGFLKYFVEGAGYEHYLTAVPNVSSSALRLSSRLVALVKGVRDA